MNIQIKKLSHRFYTRNHFYELQEIEKGMFMVTGTDSPDGSVILGKYVDHGCPLTIGSRIVIIISASNQVLTSRIKRIV